MHERFFQKAMGLAIAPERIVLASLFQIIHLENALSPGEKINHTYDACYVPRLCHVTGVLDAHDVGSPGRRRRLRQHPIQLPGQALAAHSFRPVWKPPFISRIIDEDRCHLNGLAMENGRPRYVTAVSRSDTIDGWRDRRADGGIVMDVGSNAIVCEGLSMPHSPRMHERPAVGAEFGHRRNGLRRDRGLKGASSRWPSAPASCAAWRSMAAMPSSGCRKPRYERFEGLALDRRLKPPNPNHGPACR